VPARVELTDRVFLPLFAQSAADVISTTLEWEWPYSWWDALPIVMLLLAMGASVRFAIRDTRRQPGIWTPILAAFRVLVLAVGVVIALNPHFRTQTDAYRPSRVILLVDTSQSMQQPETDPRQAQGNVRTRAEAVQNLLSDSDLLRQLRQDHLVEVYTFDADLSQPAARLETFSQESRAVPSTDAMHDEAASAPQIDWKGLLEPKGLSTRLGDSLDTLLVEARSSTLSGVVILTDGASNAGREVTFPRERAQEQGVRLVTVGVGSTDPPVNLELAKVIAPTDVQKGDSFELTAILLGQGVAGRNVRVDLLQKGPSDPEPVVVSTAERTIAEDRTATEVVFELRPVEAGAFEYTVRATLEGAVETREDDNQLDRSVSIYDRPLRVLVMAGGPLRDYQFARNALHRSPSVQVDIWLQSGQPGISQESRRLLFKFPETVEDLYEYDVLAAFDSDWSRLDAEQRSQLSNWVANEGGGLILIAGDVFTPLLAADPELDEIRRLYPVLLDEVGLQLGSRDTATTPFPLGFTQEGQVADFLKLEEDDGKSAYDAFPGVYRSYPTRGAKAGATVYAEFTDPLSRGAAGQPILLAGQRYGQGQVLYLGSPEMWRLRSINPGYLDRFWIKAVRKAAEGRSKRGLQRSMFILEGREFTLGQTIPIRLRALNPQYQPLVAETLTLDAYGPGGVPILPGPELRRDSIRPAEYVGDFRPMIPGRYRLEFAVPDSSERINVELDVQIPRQEASSLIQNAALLEQLVEGTGGAYLTLAEAAEKIPALLPNKGERVVIDQQIRELWDRRWIMFLLIGLLSFEWLMRKLLKLA